ncbi:MAG: Cof-type HAD-IIB family hydrolase [Treponema sp.]|nr:Cof-type HAD-IIB family hydrolase [Treponema sp.]
MTKLPDGKLDPKIIALDLDDTLLDSELKISDGTVKALKAAAQKGIFIVPCSGRTENAILPFVRCLDIAGTPEGRYIIASNGTSIFDLHTRQPVFSAKVDGEILVYCAKAAAQAGFPCQVYDPSTIYASVDNDYTQLDAKLCNLKLEVVPDFENFLMKGHPKMVIPGDPEKLQILQAKLKEELGSKAVIFISKPYFLEVMPPDCGKGEALLILAEKLGIDQKYTMSFGDSMNDESMMRMANYSVAMCNGLEYIQQISKFVTRKSNNEDGIGDFLTEFVL